MLEHHVADLGLRLRSATRSGYQRTLRGLTVLGGWLRAAELETDTAAVAGWALALEDYAKRFDDVTSERADLGNHAGALRKLLHAASSEANAFRERPGRKAWSAATSFLKDAQREQTHLLRYEVLALSARDDTRPTTAAAKMAKMRREKKAGVVMRASVPLFESGMAALIARGLIPAKGATRREIEAAVASFLSEKLLDDERQVA